MYGWNMIFIQTIAHSPLCKCYRVIKISDSHCLHKIHVYNQVVVCLITCFLSLFRETINVLYEVGTDKWVWIVPGLSAFVWIFCFISQTWYIFYIYLWIYLISEHDYTSFEIRKHICQHKELSCFGYEKSCLFEKSLPIMSQ